MLASPLLPPSASCSHMAKRPKLSLQTSALPITYGAQSRLSTIATPTAGVTPTTLNTFSNSFDLAYRLSPLSSKSESIGTPSTRSPSALRRRTKPYQLVLPFGVKSILKGSNLSRSATASPRSNARRVFFPQTKRVSFRANLEEEVVTQKYTVRHSDLFVPEVDESILPSIEDDADAPATVEEAEELPHISAPLERRVRICSRTEVRSIAPVSAVPDAGNSRKRRRWEWTLSPVQQEPDNIRTDEETDSDRVVVPRSESGAQNVAEPPRKRRACSLDGAGRPVARPRPVKSATL